MSSEPQSVNSRSVADRLRRARIALGYRTAKEFSDKHEIPQPTYATHEAGTRKITLETAVRYAKLLNIRVGWLLFGEGPSPEGVRILEELKRLEDKNIHTPVDHPA